MPEDQPDPGALGATLSDAETPDALDLDPEFSHRLDRQRFSTDTGLFVVESGPKAGARYGLEADLTTVGGHSAADILLDDVTVSRQHVEVERSGDRYRVKDTGSLNGTYLNGDRIESGWLDDGDVLQVGRFKLVFFHGTRS